ncbi:MAG: Ig-like domain-containing protein, partial [Anaerolineae bacterium]|nr:Ig-like domain-containing protein [Anaerolineae bacterium]
MAVAAADNSLAPGWNLVSIPEQLPDSDPAAVLSSIAGSFNRVYTYDNCDAVDPWKLYDPADSAASDLTVVDHKIGFWIEMSAADNLSVAGIQPTSTSIQLCQGWNLIGYPLSVTLPVTSALASITGKYDRIFAFDPDSTAETWDAHKVTAPTWANDLSVLEPGRGYWIHATENTTLIVTDPTATPTPSVTTTSTPTATITSTPTPTTTVTSTPTITPTVTVSPTVTPSVLPEIPADPDPRDGELNVMIDKTLSWRASTGATAYDLTLWPNGQSQPISPTITGLAVPTFNPPGDFEFGTLYNWQVLARNSSGETPGPVWTFTTERLPNLSVTSITVPPSAFAGQPFQLSWVVTNNGLGGSTVTTWHDHVYISPSPTFDANTAISLGRMPNPAFLAAGESYNQTGLFRLPANISGPYYAFVMADIDRSMRESDETDNIGVSTPTNITQLAQSDLVVTSVAGPPNAFSGSAVQVSWTVSNSGQGDATSESWIDRIYLSSDTAFDDKDPLLGAASHNGGLDAGQGYTATTTVALPQAISGDQYLFIVTDAMNMVFEGVAESNNTSNPSPPIAITLSPPADLEVTSVAVPGTAESGTRINVTWQVSNNGAGATFETNWQDRLYLTRSAIFTTTDATILGTFNHSGALDAGDEYTVSQDLVLPNGISGTYFVHVWTDFANQVFEFTSDGNNVANSRPLDITLGPSPDLLVVNVFRPLSGTVFPGNSIQVSWTVKNNRDDTPATSWSDNVYLSTSPSWPGSGQLLGSFDRPQALAAGASYTQTRTLILPGTLRADDYYIYVKADANDEVYEHNAEDNNVGRSSELLSVITPPAAVADLAIGNVTGPANATSGGSISVSWTVTNTAGSPTQANSWQDAVYLSSDSTLDVDTDLGLGAAVHAGALAGGAGYASTLNVTVPNGISGSYYLFVQTDISKKVINDTDRSNNTASQSIDITIGNSPDLRPALVDPPDTAVAGQPLAVAWSVTNAGDGPADGNWYDAIYLSNDSILNSADTQLKSQLQNGPLAASASYTATATVTIPAGSSGVTYLLVKTDSRNDLYEHESEDNNVAAWPLNITLPPQLDLDLSVPTVTVPVNVAPGQPLTISWTIENSGTVTASGSICDAVFISADVTWDVNDVRLGSLCHTISLSPNGTTTAELTAPAPGLTPGSYYAIVRTDTFNQIREVDEGNNAGVSTETIEVDVTSPTLGVPITDALAPGETRVYEIVAPAGETMVIRLDSEPDTAATDLFVSYGRVPSRQDFDFGGEPLQADQEIVVPSTRAGSYFIVVGNSGGSGNTFTLATELLDFELLEAGPAQGGKDGRVTLQLGGAALGPNVKAALDDGTTRVEAVAIYWFSPSEVYATFDLTDVPLGNYDIRLEEGTQTATLPNGFEVVPPIPGEVLVQMNAPGSLRPGERGVLSIAYFASGNNDLTPPLLDLSASGAALQLPGQTEFAGDKFQYLAINPHGPAGILIPGTAAAIQLAFRHTGGTPTFDLQSLDNSEAAIDWAAVKDSVRPAAVPDEAWEAVWSNFTASVGSTQAKFLTVLAGSANRLSLLGRRTGDPSELLALKLEQADTTAPIGALAQALDAGAPAPGLPLEFGRVYLASRTGRATLGPLGLGWVHQWEVKAIPDADGNVTIQTMGGYRLFERQTDGSYQGTLNDQALLTEAAGTYRLQETDGTVLVFLPGGQLGSIEDVNHNRISLTYDAARLTSLTHSSGAGFTLSYNNAGRISRLTDQTGRLTTYSYDPGNERLLSISGPDGTISYAYNNDNTLASVTYPGDTHDYFAYDTAGRLIRTWRDGETEIVTYSYDSDGGITVTDAGGAKTTLLAGDGGQIGRTVDALGRTTEFSYDDNGNLVGLDGPGGVEYRFNYDDRGNLTSQTDPLGRQVKLNYDTSDRPLSLTDARGNSTGFTYDGAGNLTHITHPDGSAQIFNYDNTGNVTGARNRRGATVAFSYNTQGQVTRKQYPNGRRIDYSYDEHGNLTSATDSATGAISMDYNGRDLLTRIEYPDGHWFTFDYDAAGRRTRRSGDDGYTLNYDYDAAGRLVGLSDGTNNELVRYSYDEVGRLKREDKGNGTYTSYDYDEAGQLLSLVNYGPDDAIQSRFDYTYDVQGNRTSMTTLEGTTTYQYDPLGQLIGETRPDDYQVTYRYDAAGNRISVTDDGTSTVYTTNEMNQYTQVGTTNYAYDDDGNMTSKTDDTGTTSYTYDVENRLVHVDAPDGDTWDYTYDALGDRTEVRRNGVVTRYVHDPIGLVDVAAEYDNSGALAARYVHGAGLVARLDATSSAAYYNFDATGHTRQVTDASGEVANRYDYDAFGVSLQVNENIANPFHYVGRFGVMEEGDGLIFMRARFYDIDLGRFTALDPIGLASDDLNLYQYSSNNPVYQIDASGFQSSQQNNSDPGAEAVFRMCSQRRPIGIGLVPACNRVILLTFLVGFGLAASPLLPMHLQSLTAMTVQVGPFTVIAGPITYDIGQGVLNYYAYGWPTIVRAGIMLWQDRQSLVNAARRVWRKFHTFGNLLANRSRSIWKRFTNNLKLSYQNLTSTFSRIARSYDPNDIVGPPGHGDARWVGREATLDYTIHFENDENLATAPAQLVTVEQVLDSDLDPRRFRLGAFGFRNMVFQVPENRAFYQTRLDLQEEIGLFVDVNAGIDITTGRVFWIFQSIDPATGGPPTDATAGFLPPDVVEGQGFVQYTVKSKSTVQTGDVIDAEARIVFDTNDPIDTPPIFNTLDADPPTSHLDPLPTEIQDTEIILTWNSADVSSGSGPKDVDLYVSVDDGPFVPEQIDLIDSTAVFQGGVGHTYEFFTLAEDQAGNREPFKSSPEARTLLFVPGVPARLSLTADPASLVADGSSTSQIEAMVRDGRGNPLAGQPVGLTTTLGSLSPPSGTTDAGGLVTAVLTAGATTGTADVTAATGNLV